MSIRQRPGAEAAGAEGHQQADLDSPDARASVHRRIRVGTSGAPPSNTAPDNSTFVYQPLRWGIDSLYLSYRGELSAEREAELRILKSQAQARDFEAARAQIHLGNHVFEVKDKSSGLFAFTLVDDAFMIRIAAGRSKKLPMAYVQVSSRILSHQAPAEIERELRSILEALGTVQYARVSRVDLFLDFASTVNMEAWSRDAWVTKASAVHQYAENNIFTGWSIGAGGAVMARLYHKLIESKKSGKDYLQDLWRMVGWDGERPVWRMEFEFKREVLAQLGLDGLPSVLGHRGGLWSYATAEWLRLCVPSESDQTRSRWPSHPLWAALSSVDWESSGGPLLRTYQPVRAPSMEWLGSRGASVIASLGALVGTSDFDTAVAVLKRHAYDSLSLRNGLSGITVEQFFAEKVEVLTRQYNMRMNPKAPDPEPPYRRNEYERQSRG